MERMEQAKDLDSLKVREVLDIPELNLTDSRLEQAKEVWLCSYQNLVNDLKGFSHEQRAAGFFELGWRAADENPPKGTSLIKWQTGEPAEDDWYLVSLKSGYVNIDYFHQDFNGGWFEYGNHIDPIIAWCKLSDVEPYKEE